MKEKAVLLLKNSIRPILFILAGAVIGFAYYNFVGCSGGTCVITSSPVRTVLYTSVLGFLISLITKKEKK